MLVAIILFSIAAQPPKEFSAEAKKELKKLEGKWKMVKVTTADKESEVKELDVQITFKDTEATLSSPQKEKKESVHITALDPTTDPKCIDLLEKREGKPERTLEGVYKIDGDVLQIAFTIPKDGKSRPTSFDKPDERGMIWTFKRIKE